MPPDADPNGPGLGRLLFRLAIVIACVLALNLAAQPLFDLFEFEMRPSTEPQMHRMVMAAAAIYAVLLALPFVPGAEIGLTMLGMLGPPVAPLVYGATLVGLSVAFAVGRLVPARITCRGCRRLGLVRLADMVQRAAAAPPDQGEIDEALRFAPGRLGRLLVRHRYIALAVALNLPGNVVIGGGGGLALFAGLSRLYSPLWFFVTIALAVAPVPLAVLVFGRSPF